MPHDERQAERQAKNSLFSLFSPSAELPRAWLLAERKFALETLFFTFYPFSIVWSLFLGLGPACIRPLGTKYASDIEF